MKQSHRKILRKDRRQLKKRRKNSRLSSTEGKHGQEGERQLKRHQQKDQEGNQRHQMLEETKEDTEYSRAVQRNQVDCQHRHKEEESVDITHVWRGRGRRPLPRW